MFRIERIIAEHNLNADSHRNIIITFWPIYNIPWNLHENSFRGICISRQITKQMYAKTIYLLCVGNKVFVKYPAQGGLTASPLGTLAREYVACSTG